MWFKRNNGFKSPIASGIGLLGGLWVCGCNHQEPLRNEPAACEAPTIASPDVSVLRAVFNESGNSANPKSEWFGRLYSVTEKLGADAALRDAAMAYLRSRPEDDASNFVGTLQCATFRSLVASRDDDRLRTYLSSIPIEVDGPDGAYIEFAIVDPFADSPRLSALQILFDAYECAELPDVRENLVRAVRRAFYHSIRPAWLDSEIMSDVWARDFMRDIRFQKVNPAYVDAYPSGGFEIGNVVPPPLLIPKDGPDEVKRVVLPSGRRHPPDWK